MNIVTINPHNRLWLYISVSINIIFGLSLLWLWQNRSPEIATTPELKFVRPAQPFVDPDSSSSAILHYQELKPLVDARIAEAQSVTKVGFFMQDLQTGAWLGINERDGFLPASLLKVPIMMSVLKKVDRQEIRLTDLVTLTAGDLNSAAGDLYKQGAGTKLSYWDLIKHMIQESDNTAKNALSSQLSGAEINSIFEHVGIPNPYLTASEHSVSARAYSRILKSLYLSTYLSPQMSERALDIMTDTKTEVLLPAKLPSEIQVAHKFSEAKNQIGDCGIVFHPRSPYSLCIIVNGPNPEQDVSLLVDLSKIVFDFVDSR